MNRFHFHPRSIVSDATAGLVLGIESIPAAMASGILAALNPIQAVFAVLLSTPVGAIFSSSVYMSVQTTSAMSLIIASVPQVHQGDSALSFLLALTILTGILMLALGLLKLGSLLRFVPHSVMVGFINAVAILIILGQLGNLTGYSGSGDNKVAQAINLLLNLDQVDGPTLAVGIATILLILILEKTRLKTLGLVVAILVASMLVPLFSWDSVSLVGDIAEIPGSLPTPQLPPLSAFPAMLVPAISLAFVGLVQGAGVSKNYANPDGEYPSTSRDFIGQGAANIAAGLFQGMPVGGSVSATALVVNSGAQSRLANIFAGVVMVVVLLLFGSAIGNLAMPALAGLLIVIGFRTLKPDEIEMVLKTGPVQQVVMLLTFVATLFIPLQYAVLLGVSFSILLYVVQQSNQVEIKEWIYQPGDRIIERDAPEELPPGQVTILMTYGSLFFAAATVFEKQLPEISPATRHAVVILNLRGKEDLGSTFLQVIERYAENLLEAQNKLMLVETSQHIISQLEQTGIVTTIGRENVFKETEVFGESVVEAYHQAEIWIETQHQAS